MEKFWFLFNWFSSILYLLLSRSHLGFLGEELLYFCIFVEFRCLDFVLVISGILVSVVSQN